MPDMQTELSKVINSWENETDMNEKRNGAPITTGVSHATYNYVKNHPGVTKPKAIEILNIQGYKPTSTTTLLAAMIRNKQIIVDLKGGMTVAKDTYEPIKTQVKAKPKQVRNASAQRKARRTNARTRARHRSTDRPSAHNGETPPHRAHCRRSPAHAQRARGVRVVQRTRSHV